MIPVLLVSPAYFGIQVVKSSDSPTETKGYWIPSAIGQTVLFKIYIFLVLFLESVLPLISLLVMNIIAVVKFRKIKTMIANVIEQRTQETLSRYTKLIIILTFICISTRSLDTTLAIYRRVNLFIGIVMTDKLEALFQLFRHFSLFLLFAEHALDGVLYYIFDMNMTEFLKRDTTLN